MRPVPAYTQHVEIEAAEYIVDVFMSPSLDAGLRVSQVRLSDGLGPFVYADGLAGLDFFMTPQEAFAVCAYVNNRANEMIA